LKNKLEEISPAELFEKINYEREWFDKGGKHSLENRVSDLIEYLPEEPVLDAIDVGCAEGEMIEYFSDYFQTFDGVEKSESLYKIARDKFRNSSKTMVTQASIDSYELPRSYDFVYFLGVLHYFEREEQRENILGKLMERTNRTIFVRTSFLENRVSRPSEKKPHIAKLKSCSLLTIAKLCDVHGFRWHFIDNRYRGTGDTRLGDLVIMERVKVLHSTSQD